MDFMQSIAAAGTSAVGTTVYQATMSVCSLLHFSTMLLAIVGVTGVLLESSDVGANIYGARAVEIYATNTIVIKRIGRGDESISVPCDAEKGSLDASLAMGVLAFLMQLYVFTVTFLRVVPCRGANIHFCDNACCFPPHKEPLMFCSHVMVFLFDILSGIFLLVAWSIPVHLRGDVPSCGGMQFVPNNANANTNGGSAAYPYTYSNMGFDIGYGSILLIIAGVLLMLACLLKWCVLWRYRSADSGSFAAAGAPSSLSSSSHYRLHPSDYGYSHRRANDDDDCYHHFDTYGWADGSASAGGPIDLPQDRSAGHPRWAEYSMQHAAAKAAEAPPVAPFVRQRDLSMEGGAAPPPHMYRSNDMMLYPTNAYDAYDSLAGMGNGDGARHSGFGAFAPHRHQQHSYAMGSGGGAATVGRHTAGVHSPSPYRFSDHAAGSHPSVQRGPDGVEML